MPKLKIKLKIPKIPKDIFQCIPIHITDPGSFKSYALCCKRAAKTCRELEELKKQEFSKKKIRGSKRFTTISICLPNGTKHGQYNRWYNNGKIRKNGYYSNGYPHTQVDI